MRLLIVLGLLATVFLPGFALLSFEHEGQQLSFHNEDFLWRNYRYDLQGEIIVPSFEEGCVVKLPPPPLNSTQALALVFWPDAYESGCTLYHQIFDQFESLFELSGVLIRDDKWNMINRLPYGHATTKEYSFILTRIDREPHLLLNETRPAVSLTNEKSKLQVYLESAQWKAFQWVFFIIWTLLSLYALAHLTQIIVLNFNRLRRIFQYPFYVFFLSFAGCFVHTVELAYDPHWTFYRLSFRSYLAIFWFITVMMFCSVSTLVFAWIEVVCSSLTVFSKRAKVASKAIIYILGVYLVITAVLVVVFTNSTNRAMLSAMNYIYFGFIPFLLVYMVFFVYYTIRVLSTLRVFLLTDKKEKGRLMKKMSISILVCFGALLLSMVLTALRTFYHGNSLAFMLVFRLFLEIAYLGMFGTLCILFSPRKLLGTSNRTTDQEMTGEK